MSVASLLRCLALLAWGLTLIGTLSIANWPGDWGHSVCGIWGCGPPLQSLVACHGSWFVLLIPLTIIARQWASTRSIRIAASISLTTALIGLLGVAVYEYLVWYGPATELQRQFFGRRVGLTIISLIEVPFLQTMAISTVLLLTGRRSNRSGKTGTQLTFDQQAHEPDPGEPKAPAPAVQ